MEWLMWLLIAFVVFCAFYLFLISPAREKNEAVEKMRHMRIAHRGLHDPDQGIPENSLAAFQRAVDNGFAVEFDIHITADGQIVVFHDDTLDRMTEGSGPITDKTFRELRELHLAGTDEKIPTLSEVLAVINGKVPIVCEFKFDAHDPDTFCKTAFALLDVYEGLWVMESFDPRLVGWVKKHRPKVGRGQLATVAEPGQRSLTMFATGGLLLNFISRPHFIAYNWEYSKKRLASLICLRLYRAPFFEWTVRKESIMLANELEGIANIFENFIPQK